MLDFNLLFLRVESLTYKKQTKTDMKKILSFIIISMVFISCEVEKSDNGDLDGFWHLTAIDSLNTGGHTDLRKQRIFWAIEAKLLHLTDYSSGVGSFYMRFNQTSDSLIVHSPYIDHWHEDSGIEGGGGDIPLTEPDTLRTYGINGLEDHFVKEKLDGSHMVLKSNKLRLYFTNF